MQSQGERCAYTWADFDEVQVCYASVSGAVKNAVLTKKQLQDEGATQFSFQDPASLSSLQRCLYDESSLRGQPVIDLATLTPRPSLSTDEKKVGGAMCQLVPPSVTDDPISPRHSAQRILERLRNQGFTVKSAFEAEFTLFEADETTYFNNYHKRQYGRLDNMVGKEALLLDICMAVKKSGTPIETFMSEFGEGQYEITFCPEEGVASADSIVLMKETMKKELKKHGAAVSFMACATQDEHATGFHLNHSLWTEDGRNAFLDESDPDFMSDVVRHWMAGLIHHSPALTALFCPTVNCFRRLENEPMCPKTATWGIENRLTLLRLKNECKNVYVENRMPSSACNTYLALAATVAAGLDGLVRKLECPPQRDCENAPKIPTSMSEALTCLENDTYMKEAIGGKLVDHFIQIGRQLLSAKKDGSLSSFIQEKELYFDIA